MKAKESEQKIPFKAKLIGFLLSCIMRTVFHTSRKVYLGREHIQKLMDDNQPFILTSWHNRNILAVYGYLSQKAKDRRFTPLASASRDGSYASEAMRNLGVDCIRGSSSRGGTQALRSMIRNARKGCDLGITPDGPRGPKYVVQKGVITTAKMTQLPILPVAYCAKRHKRLNSWDSMIVPWPFTTLRYVYGEPIYVPKDISEDEIEVYRLKVEQAMMDAVALSEQF